MSLVITDFDGFEHNGIEGITLENPNHGVRIVTDPAPQSPKETYTLYIPTSDDAGEPNLVATKSVTEDTDFIWSCYIRFNFADGTFPSNAFTLFEAVATGPTQCWRIRYDEADEWFLEDADSTNLGTKTMNIVENRWYRVDIRWNKDASGFFKLWTTDMLTNVTTFRFDVSGMKTEAVGSSNVVSWRFGSFAQGGISDDMTDYWVSAYYTGTGATSDADIVGDFDVLGAYRADHNATSVPDWYSNNLTTGNWDDVFEVPFNAANFGRYTVALGDTLKGGMACDGGSRPGPKGDTAIDGEPLAAKYLFAGFKPAQSRMWYLWGRGSDPTIAPGGRAGQGSFASSGLRTKSFVADRTHSHGFPRIQEDYFKMGLEALGNNFFDTVNCDIYDAAAFLLQKRKTDPALVILGDTSILGNAKLAGG